MESGISDDEIDALLKEVGFGSAPASPELRPMKEEALEQLLGEMISPAFSDDETSPSPTHGDTPKRSRFPLAPVWLSTVVLGAFLIGGVLGFFWGKAGSADPTPPALVTIDSQLNTLIEEVRKLSQWVDLPSPPPEEIIEPLFPPKDDIVQLPSGTVEKI